MTAYSGPFPVTWTLLEKGQTTESAEVEGRSSGSSPVDRPKLMQGTWVRRGGVVLEASFASAIGIHVGDRLSLGGSSLEVTGIAVTAAIPAYPGVCGRPIGCFLLGNIGSYNPGLVWATEFDAAHIAGSSGPEAYVLNLKLNDPGKARAFATHYDNNASPTAPTLYSWQSIRDGDAQVLAKVQKVLFTGSWLLALLAVASVAVLVGGRMTEQTPPGGAVEGGRGHTAVRSRRAPLRARTGGPVRRRGGAARRGTGGAVGRRSGRGPPRCPKRPVAHRHHRRAW